MPHCKIMFCASLTDEEVLSYEAALRRLMKPTNPASCAFLLSILDHLTMLFFSQFFTLVTVNHKWLRIPAPFSLLFKMQPATRSAYEKSIYPV